MEKTHKLLLALSRRLDLPAEVLVGDPLIELKGRNELTVQRHRGIVGYDDCCICIGTDIGVLRVQGVGLRVFRMNREQIVIYGEVSQLILKETV